MTKATHCSYFDESHEMLRDLASRFVREEIEPHVDRWEEEGIFPRELHRKAGERGLLGVCFGEEYGGTNTDLFHAIVVSEELTRSGAQGIAAGLGSHMIALPPILFAGTEEQKRRFIPPTLSGETIAALAITEPDAGSDVANIKTKAVRDGDHYIVNGAKTYITSGTRADFLTTAVRTGGPGHEGISLLVIERDTPGLRVSKSLKKMGWRCSDTAELAFEDCRVPVANLIGTEGSGFKWIMQNFLSERIQLAVMAVTSAAMACEAALTYAGQREAFGKPLIAKQVIRHKLVDMQSRVEVARQFVYHAAGLAHRGEMAIRQVAIAKNAAVEACRFCADEAVQIFGGLGYMQGVLVERIYRDSRLLPIGGGTTEIMKEIIWKTMQEPGFTM